MAEFRSGDFKAAMLRVFHAAKTLCEGRAADLNQNLLELQTQVDRVEKCDYLADLDEALKYHKNMPVVNANQRQLQAAKGSYVERTSTLLPLDRGFDTTPIMADGNIEDDLDELGVDPFINLTEESLCPDMEIKGAEKALEDTKSVKKAPKGPLPFVHDPSKEKKIPPLRTRKEKKSVSVKAKDRPLLKKVAKKALKIGKDIAKKKLAELT